MTHDRMACFQTSLGSTVPSTSYVKTSSETIPLAALEMQSRSLTSDSGSGPSTHLAASLVVCNYNFRDPVVFPCPSVVGMCVAQTHIHILINISKYFSKEKK